MTRIAIEDFSGMAPKVQPLKLALNMAVLASNTRFESGGVTAWAAPTTGTDIVTAPTDLNSIYFYQGDWITSSNVRQYVKSFIPGDVHERIFYTDGAYPKVRSGSSEYRLGLPRPPAPDITVLDAGYISNPTDERSQSYVVTLVDVFGVEGPSSLPSTTVDVGVGSSVELSLSGVSGNYNLGAGAFFRIYRSNTGSDGSAIYQYAMDVPYSGTTTVTDSLEPGQLQEALQSETWVAAPDDNSALYPGGPLASMVEYPGGILAGHSGNTLHFSYPYVPTAWPYSYSISDEIKGVVVIQGGLLVCTTGRPRLYTGGDPSLMQEIPIESFESCVSSQSIVDMGDFAIYASPRGLVMCQGNSATLATEQLFDHASWQVFNPASIVAWRHEDHYIARYGDSSDGTWFVFTPGAGTASFVLLELPEISAGYFDSDEGELYLAQAVSPAGTYDIGRFNRGTPLDWVWQKTYRLPDPVSLSCIRVVASAYPVKVSLYTGTLLRGAWLFPDDKPVKLPSGYVSQDWQVKIESAGMPTALNYVVLADAMAEID